MSTGCDKTLLPNSNQTFTPQLDLFSRQCLWLCIQTKRFSAVNYLSQWPRKQSHYSAAYLWPLSTPPKGYKIMLPSHLPGLLGSYYISNILSLKSSNHFPIIKFEPTPKSREETGNPTTARRMPLPHLDNGPCPILCCCCTGHGPHSSVLCQRPGCSHEQNSWGMCADCYRPRFVPDDHVALDRDCLQLFPALLATQEWQEAKSGESEAQPPHPPPPPPSKPAPDLVGSVSKKRLQEALRKGL